MSDEYAEFQDRLDFIKATVTGYENVPRTLQRPEHRRYVSDVTYLLQQIEVLEADNDSLAADMSGADLYVRELEEERQDLLEKLTRASEELSDAELRAFNAEQEAEDWRNSLST